MNEPLLNGAAIARILQISPATVWRWTVTSKMPAYRVGRAWRYKRSEIEAFLKEGRSIPIKEEQQVQDLVASQRAEQAEFFRNLYAVIEQPIKGVANNA